MSVFIGAADLDGVPVNVRLDADRISAVGPSVRPEPGDEIFDAAGGALIPGLHDHHLHLRAHLAASRSVRLDELALSTDGFTTVLGRAAASVPDGEWLRGVGWSETGAGALDRHTIDAVVADRPVRLQHRSGALWVLNSRALELVGAHTAAPAGIERDAAGEPTGRLWRLDGWLRERVPAGPPDDMRALSTQLARLGITGLTDATVGRTPADVEAFAELVADGSISQRLMLMAPAGTVDPGVARLSLGPRKVVLDDDDLPTPEDLASTVVHSHAAGVGVAVHCVTAEQLITALAAFDTAGSRRGDRIEHAGIVPPGFATRLAELHLTVVTQPGFLAERGDLYRRDVAAEEQPWLYPCAGLLAAGVEVAAGSDAPYGPLDPWVGIVAAMTRRGPSGRVLNAAERVGTDEALALYLGSAERPGRPRRIEVGAPGDVCVLNAPWSDVRHNPAATAVAATVAGGRVLADVGTSA